MNLMPVYYHDEFVLSEILHQGWHNLKT